MEDRDSFLVQAHEFQHFEKNAPLFPPIYYFWFLCFMPSIDGSYWLPSETASNHIVWTAAAPDEISEWGPKSPKCLCRRSLITMYPPLLLVLRSINQPPQRPLAAPSRLSTSCWSSSVVVRPRISTKTPPVWLGTRPGAFSERLRTVLPCIYWFQYGVGKVGEGFRCGT